MPRILVIGNSGSGKTTLAKKLAKELNIPQISLDTLYWKPGWVESIPEEFDIALIKELERDAWVMDGNYSRTLPLRLGYADTVIFLDYNSWRCAFRALKRWLIEKEPQAKGCPQKVDFEFLKYILLDYRISNRPNILEYMRHTSDDINWLSVTSPKDANKTIQALISAQKSCLEA